jgi:hypothetical protein
MENTNQKLGYIREFHSDKEIVDWVTRSDLSSNIQEKKDLVQSWICGLAEPWSDSAESFVVRRNCMYDGTIVPESEAWEAIYTSIFYDFLESCIVVYGATPIDALANAEGLLKEMIAIYDEKYADEEDAE